MESLKPPAAAEWEGAYDCDLPQIPGAWTTREVTLAGRSFSLTLPADPDAFLEAPAEVREHQCDGYMPYWPYLWPAAIDMGRRVLETRWTSGMRALEIGAGVGLVGIAAASAGLDVTVSDYRVDAVRVAMHNARRNGLASVRGRVLDWRSPPAEQWPLILGCDVVYELAHHEPILALLEKSLDHGGSAWIGDAGRQHAAAFVAAACRRGFSVALSGASGAPLLEPQVGAFQLIVLEFV
ncbi:MAG: methyltransferase [Planctomycetes bacterium]|nr:methyltransferase [Planctomycetota bacterium]